ncbi:type IV pilin N-terminal domain-containing protein [Halogeometricum sp. S1BR25-6]|uniref:Type IV pilin N-terminal domain-containing protein n=1 Tax=Halogeometricum salsisoli TaxID=2950536 RepID=A0ABU2GH64_9EURY|nr:type IV pilin N-terminal domain-containing protein [Halogeometricum sp. S1BR25-6]MDS0300167.1 type IV pilin N-terminal domain-containing protein [Halogeometricum sp. S1BR25-6]
MKFFKIPERFSADDRAVSPVLGVALLIAMTVILAGVVGYVALGVDADSADAPQTKLAFKQSGTGADNVTVTVVHKGGDKLVAGEVVAKTTGADGGDVGVLTTGDTKKFDNTSPNDVITIVWQDPDSDREVLLAEYVVE